MLVKEAMSTKIETIAPNTTVQECARKMDQTGIGLLAVWENGKVIGVLTDRDICCRAVAGGQDPAIATARDIMSRNAASCFEDQDCTEAARIMEQKHVRRLTVMNHKDVMVGLLSVDDLARYSHDLAGAVLEAASPWPH
ncbi:inosine-5-monophosphate dehydrogenase [Hypericibacter terrae]|jgi:predicted transcriptional regulator|uniref:Inosine-5-monophosphate dehydrogenase n=1 Tax=Hypericibacter terrae TaxID=2602015 RepID=A0A5J6MD34_9PROT|nr:CBS domain-containing protein [Hypericibacter terrae]QEX15348.1 inosine-5-monophosphate dehydrogenase [Hypericibacter terrae]